MQPEDSLEEGSDSHQSQSTPNAANTSRSHRKGASGKQRVPSKAMADQMAAEMAHVHVEPANVIEYEWPVKSGEKFFI